jgi:hypothetical protein
MKRLCSAFRLLFDPLLLKFRLENKFILLPALSPQAQT